MKVKIVLRVDDVTQLNLFELSDWFTRNYPEIPVCVYLMRTHLWNKHGWSHLKRLILEYGWEAGGHTRTHKYLSAVDLKTLKEEIFGNISDIEQGLKSVGLDYKVSTFAYPFGDHDFRAEKLLSDIGVVGMTYLDYYPYISFPSKFNLLSSLEQLGVTVECRHPYEILNKCFDKASRYGIYILSMHTRLWKYPLFRSFSYLFKLKFSDIFSESKVFFGRLVLGSDMYAVLKKHLEYILNRDNIKFVTFKELLDL